MQDPQTPPTYDVAIIGMGPVGVTLAGLLGSFGRKVLAIDAEADVYALPRAIGMDHEVMRVFQQIGAADALQDCIGAYRPSEYRTAEGDVIRRLDSRPPPYQLGWPPYLTFVQPDLERTLRKVVADIPSVALLSETRLVAFDQSTDQVSLTLQNNGHTRTETARFVVGCDGGGSFVRKTLGIEFEDLGFDEPWLVVDVLINDGVELPETNIQFCDPDRPHTYVVGPGNLRRWEFMLMPGEDPKAMAEEATVRNLLSPWIRPDQARIWRAATYRFHALIAERWRDANVFLAGDSCHMTPPFLAQGMVQGIKDVANLAWKLDAVIAGADGALLDTYQAERRPLVRDVISITRDLGRVICETDREKAGTRNTHMRAEMQAGRGFSIRQDLFPPIAAGPLCLPSQTKAAGRPAPQPQVLTRDGEVPLDSVTGHRFALLMQADFSAHDQDLERARAMGLAVVTIGTDILPDVSGVFETWMAEHHAKAVLTRPDHVVMAGMASPDDLAAALDAIAKALFTGPTKR